MAQLVIVGPVICGRVGTRLVEVDRIDPQRAEAALRALGHREEAARLIAHQQLDSAAARRLGRQYGLIEREVIPTL